jgi:hypothetical protein
MGGVVLRKMLQLRPDLEIRTAKFLTVGTPHEGVPLSPAFAGQLKDLHRGSDFLCELNESYPPVPQWGALAGLDLKAPWNRTGALSRKTDSGGPGFIEISSALPLGEWKGAYKNFDHVDEMTEHLGFRLLVDETHVGLLFSDGIFRALNWLFL